MSHHSESEALAMFRSGSFSIKEVAAHCGASEWQVAALLIRVGAIRRLN